MDHQRVREIPLVSVVVPAYNAAAYIEPTLCSILSQTYPKVEIVVVDDGSDDETRHRVQRVANCHHSIRIIGQRNAGVAAARNRGIQASRGELIATVDADDIWYPCAVERLVACFLNSEQHVGVAYGWWVTIDEDGLLDGRFHCSMIEGDVLGTLVCHNFLGNASSTMIRRDCFEQVGWYDPGFRARGAQGCEDWDLYLRIARHYRFRVVPEFLFGYRKIANSMSSDATSMAKSHQYMLEKLVRRHPGVPAAFCRLSTSSFHIHLAHECQRQRRPSQCLFWLYRALRSGPIFTIARVAFYTLVVKAFVAMVGSPNRLVSGRLGGRRSCLGTSAPARHRRICVADVARRRRRIRIMNTAQTVLHRVISRIPFD